MVRPDDDTYTYTFSLKPGCANHPPYQDAFRKLKGGEISQQARLKARKKTQKKIIKLK